MSRQEQGISSEEISSYRDQCVALSADWKRVHDLLEAFQTPGADRERLELEYMALRSKLSCDYPILSYWRKGGFGLGAGINKTLALGGSLAALAESVREPEKGAQRHWQAAWDSLRKILEVLQGAERRLAEGKAVELPPELLVHNTHVPFPIRKILKVLGTIAAVALLAGTFYVMRNFLGFWAPEAGAGLATEGLDRDAQIETVLVTMNEAFRTNDVDRFMTVVADDFKDEDGNGKRTLRALLQTLKEQGEFAQATVNWSRIAITERDGFIDVRPVVIHTSGEDVVIHLGFKPYRGGKLLIATGSGA